MYWTVFVIATAGLLVLGAWTAQELRSPYPLTAKRTFVAAWLVAAAGVAWWAGHPGAAPLIVTVAGVVFLAATLNRRHELTGERRRTPYQPPS